MIRQDSISLTLTVLATAIFLYSATWGGELASKALFVSVLGITGLVMSMALGGYEKDARIDRAEQEQILTYTALALAVIYLANTVSAFAPKMNVAPVGAWLFLVLVAVMEEQFFRAFLTTFFYQRGGLALGIIGSASIFAVYHFAVYGTEVSVLGVIFVAGAVLSYIDLRARRVTPSMLAHIINNMLAALG